MWSRHYPLNAKRRLSLGRSDHTEKATMVHVCMCLCVSMFESVYMCVSSHTRTCVCACVGACGVGV